MNVRHTKDSKLKDPIKDLIGSVKEFQDKLDRAKSSINVVPGAIIKTERIKLVYMVKDNNAYWLSIDSNGLIESGRNGIKYLKQYIQETPGKCSVEFYTTLIRLGKKDES